MPTVTGDWADGTQCDIDAADAYALEHFVVDFPVDAAALGAGSHTITVRTNRMPWPAAATDKPAWARVTLSEIESNKPLETFGVNMATAAAMRDRSFWARLRITKYVPNVDQIWQSTSVDVCNRSLISKPAQSIHGLPGRSPIAIKGAPRLRM